MERVLRGLCQIRLVAPNQPLKDLLELLTNWLADRLPEELVFGVEIGGGRGRGREGRDGAVLPVATGGGDEKTRFDVRLEERVEVRPNDVLP